jgi:hypothetical protein
MKLRYKLRSLWEELKLRVRVIAAALKAPWVGDITPVGRLYATKINSDGSKEELGLVCTKVVTDAGVAYLVDAMQGITEPENFRYHGSGTSSTAESAAQTGLVTEVGSRATGSLTEGASANIFRTVGTVTYGGSFSITEHGIFSASSAGTMLDRSVFTGIGVISGDSIQFTYDLTFPSGS